MTQQNGRTSHGPQLLTVTRLGNPQYGVAFAFGEIEGFYKAPRDQPNMQLQVGSQYMVAWTVKDNSPNRPYLDIVSAVLPDGQIARYDPQGNMVPGDPGPQVTPEQAAGWATNPPGADYYNEAVDNPNYDDHIDPACTNSSTARRHRRRKKKRMLRRLWHRLFRHPVTELDLSGDKVNWVLDSSHPNGNFWRCSCGYVRWWWGNSGPPL